MFIISQYLLNNLNMGKLENISIYAIGIGLVVYACIYLYFLFYNDEYVSLFNKFIIYIIGIDLLLSSFYYSHNKNSLDYTNTEKLSDQEDDLSDESNISEEYEINDEISHHLHDIEGLDVDDVEETDLESNYEVEAEAEAEDVLEAEEKIDIKVEDEAKDKIDVKIENDTQMAQIIKALDLETMETMETIQTTETKKRRGRKPNSLKQNSLKINF